MIPVIGLAEVPGPRHDFGESSEIVLATLAL